MFVWLFSLCGVVMLLPFVVVQSLDGLDHAEAIGLMAGSGALHGWYFVTLQRAYRDGDLSFVYPLARGTGPLLATVAAIAVFGERPSALALLGAAVIVVAVLSLAVGQSWSAQGSAGWFALLTGVSIAAYTLWDKHAVDGAALSPELYLCGTLAFETLLLTPALALTADRPSLRALLPRAIAVGALAALAYVLVLHALRLAPVSAVAPAREVAIVFGAALGVGVLSEGDAGRRLGASVAIVAGVVLLAVG